MLVNGNADINKLGSITGPAFMPPSDKSGSSSSGSDSSGGDSCVEGQVLTLDTFCFAKGVKCQYLTLRQLHGVAVASKTERGKPRRRQSCRSPL